MKSKILIVIACLPFMAAAQPWELVIANGRVMDPETGLDAVRHLGIRGGVIGEVSAKPLQGREVLDARGLVVAPGFIDLHQHGQTLQDYQYKALDGVTCALELEVGAADVDLWYRVREGKAPIHYAVSVGHIPVRMSVMGDRPAFLPGAATRAAKEPATAEQVAQIRAGIETGLRRGAVAVGFGLQYTPQASHWEVLECFSAAAQFGASCHVHIRNKGERGPQNVFSALEEVVAASAITGAPGHILHLQATGMSATPRLLDLIAQARKRGLDITCEVYPYTAGMTDISSAVFDPGWRERDGMDYHDLQWGATGERLTADTFEKYRKTGGLVIAHSNPEELVRKALAHPLTMIASDGLPGHPRNTGTYARMLGLYARDNQDLPLMRALEKCALMPAQRLEARVPAMRNKGRIKVGADADLVLFDAAKVRDQSTYADANRTSTGIRHTLVGGVAVVQNGLLQKDALPGRAVRAPLR